MQLCREHDVCRMFTSLETKASRSRSEDLNWARTHVPLYVLGETRTPSKMKRRPKAIPVAQKDLHPVCGRSLGELEEISTMGDFVVQLCACVSGKRVAQNMTGHCEDEIKMGYTRF